MPLINLKEHDSLDVAIRRFKRAVEKAGILTTLRKNERYEKPKTERKRKKDAAVKRQIKLDNKERITKMRNKAKRFVFDDKKTAAPASATTSEAKSVVTETKAEITNETAE